MLAACGGGSSGGGGGNPVAPQITVQPVNQTVTAGGTAMFSVTATGTAPLSYQWQNAATATNIAGATSSSYSIANVTIGDSGMTFLVIVSNSAGSQTSNTVTLTVNPAPPPNNVSVLTYHNDVGRTGQKLNETILTTANVASANFGMLGSITVDGAVDAEPLYVGGMTIDGARTTYCSSSRKTIRSMPSTRTHSLSFGMYLSCRWARRFQRQAATLLVVARFHLNWELPRRL